MWRFITGVACGVVAAAIGIAATALFWPWRIEATGAPGGVEMGLMRSILNRAVAREAPHLTDPYAPSTENLSEGLKIFRNNCAGCHGDGAQKSQWGATSFLPRVPQFGSEPPRRPDWQIHWIVANGIRNTAMGSFAHLMTDDQIWKVSTFVSHVSSLPENVASQWVKTESGP
jgi:mono/diheme cytochrome c family protein